MKQQTLIVSGQGHDVKTSGGAGKYTHQLLLRLNSPSARELLPNCSLQLIQFPELHSPREFGASAHASVAVPSLKHRSKDLAKRAAKRILPGAGFQMLKAGYLAARGNQGAAAPGPNAASPAHPWFDLKNPTLLHELTNYRVSPEVGRLSLSSKFKLCVTFLDIQDYFYPEYFDDHALINRRLHYTLYKDRADAFFAISEFTKSTMVDRMGIHPDKITVTHLAADDMEIIKISDPVKSWASNLGRFILYPAKAWSHKNHEFLLRAISKRRDQFLNARMSLVLSGGFDAQDLARLNRLASDAGVSDCVRILGFQSDESLQALIRAAEFLVFPSLYEGFGMPVLEAMTLGCPVLSSTAGSLPEVAGDAAVYFDPRQEESLIAVLDQVLRDQIDRASLTEKGLRNCARFSWEKTFQTTISRYRELL